MSDLDHRLRTNVGLLSKTRAKATGEDDYLHAARV